MVKLTEIGADQEHGGYGFDSDTDDSLPELEQASFPSAPSFLDSVREVKQNRNEKKARKLMAKLGLRKVHGFKRVTLRKDKDLLIIIDNPDVFKNPAADTYVIFGQPELKDLNEEEISDEEEFVEPVVSQALKDYSNYSTIPSHLIKEDEECEDDDDLFKNNLLRMLKREKDIDLVVSHANVTRAKAIKTLKQNNDDMVNTFVDLTIGKKFRPKPGTDLDKDPFE